MNTTGATHSLRSVQQMLKLTRREVAGLVEAGFVTPQLGARGEWRFTFQDVVLLKSAWGLRQQGIPLRRVIASLRKLRATLPETLPLSGLRITAVGDEVAVLEGSSRWSAESGQLLMGFDVEPPAEPASPRTRGAAVSFIDAAEARARRDRTGEAAAASEPRSAPRAGARAARGGIEATAEALFARGEEAEAHDARAAEQAYRAALAVDPGHVASALNLGAMLCEQQRCREAVALYDGLIERQPAEALLHFNRAVALEDLGRSADALASYARCLAIAPDLADAHYNAGRLYQLAGDAQKALRHFSSYRRLQKQP